ncbi:hypothetical protein [Komagataeibacter sp. FNDCR2]|uniref:hypothetical protein n=1 Tax=Komagataeibacter sp. FNDCR2 TaxID=2878682 RepID=UPI001E4933DD|nr:hypothetical protein [Komagataeibacter sp. FNDCR2]MCE2575030.1 hypothetical protein [Komagataeibacter sp. FNDCR2]
MTNPPNLEAHLEAGIGRLQDGLDGFAGESGTPLSGRMRNAGGLAQQGLGEICDTVRDFTADRPLFALLGASFVGFVLTLISRRRR